MAMHSYQIDFYRHLVNSDGHPARSHVFRARVPESPDREQAVRTAIESFKYEWSLWDWRALADEYDVVEGETVEC